MFKLMYTQILKHLLSGPQKHKYKVLLGLDEFSQFKKFEVIAEQLPFVRSYGIKIMAFIQSISQLDEWYGHDGRKAMMDNFQMKIFLKADENETLQYFESKLGKSTELRSSVSFSSNKKELGYSSSNESVSEVGRSLMTAQELGQMPLYECVVFFPEIPPYRAKKIQYFTDNRFTSKINLPIDKLTQKQYETTFPTVLSPQELCDLHKYTFNIPKEIFQKHPGLKEMIEEQKQSQNRDKIQQSLENLARVYGSKEKEEKTNFVIKERQSFYEKKREADHSYSYKNSRKKTNKDNKESEQKYEDYEGEDEYAL